MKVPTVADTILLPLLPLQIFKITRYISLQFYLSIKGLSLISVTSDFLLVLVPYLYTLYKFLGSKDVKLSFLYSDVIM